MRTLMCCLSVLMLLSGPTCSQAQQRLRERESEFLQEKPLVGDQLPEVSIFLPDGKAFKTADLKGHYTVLTFGCLTCPPSIWNIAGLEAVKQDYAPKGVKFYFIFKSLAHPELAGNYIQPFTQAERLAQARQAEKQFGTSIPWLVDDIDNRFKHAMGDRPNSQFLLDPQGKIIRKRSWSNPGLVRKDLEELVGPVEKITREEDLQMKLGTPVKSSASRGVVARTNRLKMQALVIEPQLTAGGHEFYAKLRAEADAELARTGTGKLYLGFHLDPFHNAHWNNLNVPLSFKIDKVEGVELDHWEQSAPKISATTDADPREFMLHVSNWPSGKPLHLTATYFACVGEEACHAVKQEYLIHIRRDTDGGGARGVGAGFWSVEEFGRQLMLGDQNKDGQLTRKETPGIVLPHFDKLDANNDGQLQYSEAIMIVDWLNYLHQPGPAPKDLKSRKE